MAKARAKDWMSLALWLEPDDLLTQYNAACAYALIGEAEADPPRTPEPLRESVAGISPLAVRSSRPAE